MCKYRIDHKSAQEQEYQELDSHALARRREVEKRNRKRGITIKRKEKRACQNN